MDDPLETVWKAAWVAERLGIKITTAVTGSLFSQEGYYQYREGLPLHPLEAVLLGYEHGCGEWMLDAAWSLGVEIRWVEGFLDGFARSPDRGAGPVYEEGYLAGGSLRTHRYPRL